MPERLTRERHGMIHHDAGLAAVYRNLRNRAIVRNCYHPGFRLYEVDQLSKKLMSLSVRFSVAIPEYGVAGRDPSLSSAAEILVTSRPPAMPSAIGFAIWICGTRHRRPMSDQDCEHISHMRAQGWETTVAFAASDADPDLARLGYIPADVWARERIKAKEAERREAESLGLHR